MKRITYVELDKNIPDYICEIYSFENKFNYIYRFTLDLKIYERYKKLCKIKKEENKYKDILTYYSSKEIPLDAYMQKYLSYELSTSIDKEIIKNIHKLGKNK